MKRIDIPTPEALDRAAREFIEIIGDRRHVAFYGDMGAGKTTFIRRVATALGMPADEAANSPSFSLVNEYSTSGTGTVYHFDFYRLDSVEEALDIGVEEYFDSGALCLMEWPERIIPILPDDTVTVKLTVNDDDSRTLHISE
ncbi:MAG: tRNA (adenosine(37)-N6)-threonylcarbamoyltransferase complex ATPase subunit type 1 TsaE [Muribaculaceae bacterium]|nr:tRNA (adenosine(37)-N6)-threonylcarbamoyltransferase complex ATPase subunit type 1 TsaE [Muribaculaceae bacterium]